MFHGHHVSRTLDMQSKLPYARPCTHVVPGNCWQMPRATMVALTSLCISHECTGMAAFATAKLMMGLPH